MKTSCSIHNKTLLLTLALTTLLLGVSDVPAQAQKPQEQDTTSWLRKSYKKSVKKILGIITREPEPEKGFNVKSEDPYLKYDGKIIRKITVERVGFERNVIDTTRDLESFIARTANKLHKNTREYVIRNNLFIREGKPLNPYRVADNERTLRNLDFVMDARIYVKPIRGSKDSVDILVVTRDVFSLGGSFNPDFPDKYQFSVQENNLAGTGQRLKFGQVFDTKRSPNYGYEGLYQISNINGSFIDAALGYTKLNDGVSIGNENERSLYFRASRQLFQPFTRLAGGIEVSDNYSLNVYKESDTTFARYRYKVQDYWVGYSFGYKKLPKDLKENRNRKFFAVRGYEQFFRSGGVNLELTEPDRFAYRSRTAILSQVTFFRQDFYKTQYVAGFGRTEDIPYGYRVSFTTGWEKELGSNRPYAGAETYYNKVRQSGTILTYDVKLASYWKEGLGSQDGLVSFDFSRFSKIEHVGKLIIRHQFNAGYAVIFNQKIKRGFDINDMNGILGFSADSLVGSHRLRVSEEGVFFTRWKFFGFKLAPLGRVDLAMIRRGGALIQSKNFFGGVSLGLRARNENLIFNTIEARVFLYPKTVERVEKFRFNITTNFRIKYPTALINKPATVYNP